jgi:hypothetical protein
VQRYQGVVAVCGERAAPIACAANERAVVVLLRIRLVAGVLTANSCPSRRPLKDVKSNRDAVGSSIVSASSATVQRCSLLDARSWTMRPLLRRLEDQCTELSLSPSRHGRMPSTSPSGLPRTEDRMPAFRDDAAAISKGGSSGAGATAMGSMSIVNLRRVQNMPGAPVAITSIASSLTIPGVGKASEMLAWPVASKSMRLQRTSSASP